MAKLLTQWFRSSRAPWESGVYERKFPTGNLYCYYNAERNEWGFPSTSIGGALVAQDIRSAHQVEKYGVPWRGVQR